LAEFPKLKLDGVAPRGKLEACREYNYATMSVRTSRG
jgi:hypothetical protein